MIQLSDYLTTQEPHVNELVSKFISKRLYDIIEPMTDYDIEGFYSNICDYFFIEFVVQSNKNSMQYTKTTFRSISASKSRLIMQHQDLCLRHAFFSILRYFLFCFF